MTARAEVRNSAEKPPTATRVAGNEPLKMMTPRRPFGSPLPQPLPADCILSRPFGRRSSVFADGKNSDNPVQSGKTVLIWKAIHLGRRGSNERSRRNADH